MSNASFYSERQTDNPVVNSRLRLVLKAVVAVNPEVVLDIGCGRGTLGLLILGALPATRVYGTELNPISVAAAEATGMVVFAHDVAERIPLSDESVDIVVMGEIIEHLVDPDAVIDDVRRVLRPGGRLIITTPNLACWANRVLLFLGIQPLWTETSTRKKYGRCLTVLGQHSTVMQGHLRIFTLGSLTEMLADLGFSIISSHGADVPLFDVFPPAAWMERFFARFPRFASDIVVVAQKHLLISE